MHANEFQKCGQGSARMKRNTNAKTFKDIPMHPRWIAANAPNKLNIARRYCNSFIIANLALADFVAAGIIIWSNFFFLWFLRIPSFQVPEFPNS